MLRKSKRKEQSTLTQKLREIRQMGERATVMGAARTRTTV